MPFGGYKQYSGQVCVLRAGQPVITCPIDAWDSHCIACFSFPCGRVLLDFIVIWREGEMRF